MGVMEDRQARATLWRASLLAGWLPLGALLVAAPFVGSIPETYRYLPLVASALVFGMPHGAVDYVAYPRAIDGRVTGRGVVAVALLYLLVGGAYLAAWFLVPVAAAVGFVVLTWFHWGQGDLYVLRDLVDADHLDTLPGQALSVLVRGGLPMLVPLLGFPDRYRAVVETFVAPFGGSAGEWWLFTPPARLALGAGFALLTALALARGWRGADDRRGWRIDAAETGLLWAFFLVVPPVLAVGVYFCLWHSVRHIARVVLLEPGAVASLSDRQWGRPLGRFALEAAVPTALALALIAGLWVVAPPAETLAGATGLYLVGIAVLTLPHTVVVTALDRAQGIWSLPA